MPGFATVQTVCHTCVLLSLKQSHVFFCFVFFFSFASVKVSVICDKFNKINEQRLFSSINLRVEGRDGMWLASVQHCLSFICDLLTI